MRVYEKTSHLIHPLCCVSNNTVPKAKPDRRFSSSVHGRYTLLQRRALPPDTVLWMAPGSVSRACRFAWNIDPVNLVVATFCVNKVIQAVSFLGWWWYISSAQFGFSSSSSSPDVLTSPPSLTPLQLVIGAQLVIIGQTLNAAVYRAIGRDGVYYGGEGDHGWVECFLLQRTQS